MTKASMSALVTLMAASSLTVDARAQDLERVRALYVAAAYEEALAAIPPAFPTVRIDVEQYRALCLLALGKESAAVPVVESIVRQHPTYVAPADLSPKVRSLLDAARGRIVPAIARDLYAHAKSALDAGANEAARDGFRQVVVIIDSLAPEDGAKLADLRLLAHGFLELAGERIPPPTPIEKVPDVPPLKVAYVGPVAIQEDMPPWTPPAGLSGRAEYVGVLRVQIGADGRVTTAEVVEASHPAYDVLAVRAAKGWLYRPAMRNGDPVPSTKDIHIRLVPR